MAMKVKLDHAGVGEVLKSAEVAEEISALAESVADTVRSAETVTRHGVPVETTPYVTDRAAVAVTIAHPGGLGMQAKYGVLSDAAGAAGLEVSSRE